MESPVSIVVVRCSRIYLSPTAFIIVTIFVRNVGNQLRIISLLMTIVVRDASPEAVTIAEVIRRGALFSTMSSAWIAELSFPCET